MRLTALLLITVLLGCLGCDSPPKGDSPAAALGRKADPKAAAPALARRREEFEAIRQNRTRHP